MHGLAVYSYNSDKGLKIPMMKGNEIMKEVIIMKNSRYVRIHMYYKDFQLDQLL